LLVRDEGKIGTESVIGNRKQCRGMLVSSRNEESNNPSTVARPVVFTTNNSCHPV